MEERTEYKQFHLRLSQITFDRLERIAKIDERSVSFVMRKALNEWLSANEISVSDVKRLLEK